MKRNNRYIASIILFLVTAGFFISGIFSHTFAGRLLSALFGASMIGGIADWFGITALFRKPLGIPFRTEIIPRNRQKLYDSLVYMVEKELLTKEALKSKLDRFDISEKLIHYLEDQGGKHDLAVLVNKIVTDMLDRVDPNQAGTFLEKLINDNSSGLDFFKLFQTAAEWLSKNATDEKVIPMAVDKVKDFILFPGFGTLVYRIIQDIFDKLESNAEKETAGKRLFFKFVLTLADFSDMSPSKLSSRLLTEALEYFNSLKDPQSDQRKGFEKWLERNVAEFRSNPALQENVRQKSIDLLKKVSLSSVFTSHVYPYFKGEDQFLKLQSFIEGLVEKLASDFKQNPSDQAVLDAYIKNALIQLIEENHEVIGRMVRSKLDKFSTGMLVEMIEEKAGNDLQIIRINGSVVGGLTGLVIFLLTYWIT
ncbi:MAG: DUF445 domain-containing protein [Ruminiclostridium sp.]|nr:DUF445 domain-containing protein [Ruminiclostridium sp.]